MCSGGASVGPATHAKSDKRLSDAAVKPDSATASSNVSSGPVRSQILRLPPAVPLIDELRPPEHPELISCVARALMLVIEEGEASDQPEPVEAPSIFDSSVVPNISVERYLRRLKAVFECSDAVFVLAVIIIDRLLEKEKVQPSRITMRNVHRLYLASLIVTVKYNEDLIYGNSHFARAGGIQLREVNRLERFFMHGLDYDFHVFPEQYSVYERSLLDLRSQLPPQPAIVEEYPSDMKRYLIAKAEEAAKAAKAAECDANGPPVKCAPSHVNLKPRKRQPDAKPACVVRRVADAGYAKATTTVPLVSTCTIPMIVPTIVTYPGILISQA